jgi:hypothetical protein
MIYIYSGNDIKKINSNIKKISKGKEIFTFFDSQINKSILNEYCFGVNLFDKPMCIIIENSLISLNISNQELEDLSKSNNIFVFIEDDINKEEEKKLKKYAEVESFKINDIKKTTPFNIFSIADSFEKKDKINTWFLYRKAIDLGIEPEAISGILFWKIKMMCLVKNKNFSKDQLKIFSKDLISLYHNSHFGKLDFVIGLEKFILSSLTK